MYNKKSADRDGSKRSNRPEKRSFKNNTSHEEKRSFRKDNSEGEGSRSFRKRNDNDRPFRKDSSNREENTFSKPKKTFKSDDAQRTFNPERKKFDKDDRRERTSFKTDRDRKSFTKRNDNAELNSEPREKRSFFIAKRSFTKNNDDRKTESRTQKSNDGRVRLNKIIAASGICSRREADDMITAGLVSVNGTIITELGTKVFPNDDIRYNGERLRQERLVYIVMNKPKDFITTTKDPFAKKTVMELISGVKERVFPVGRLDRNTTGVLLVTNDGDLAKKLTHPSHNKKKIYHVHLDKSLNHQDIETISKGIELEDGFIKADEISFIDPEDKKQVGVEIHSGKNRIVRRIFEQLGYKVTKLDRVYFAGLTKKGLQRGHWRFLTNQEIGMLKMGSYE